MVSIREKIVSWADSFLRPPLLGLDISDTSIKYLKFRSGQKLSFDAFGEIAIPPGVIVSGEIKDEEAFARVLNGWLAKEGRSLRSSFVAVSLPEEKSFSRVIQLPKVKVSTK